LYQPIQLIGILVIELLKMQRQSIVLFLLALVVVTTALEIQEAEQEEAKRGLTLHLNTNTQSVGVATGTEPPPAETGATTSSSSSSTVDSSTAATTDSTSTAPSAEDTLLANTVEYQMVVEHGITAGEGYSLTASCTYDQVITGIVSLYGGGSCGPYVVCNNTDPATVIASAESSVTLQFSNYYCGSDPYPGCEKGAAIAFNCGNATDSDAGAESGS
jgi:hypothetical protein